MQIYLNGEFVSRDKAVVSVFDHGLLYGDGVFEGIRVYDGCIFRLPQHLDRLFRGADGIRLAVPLSRAGMQQAVVDTVRRNRKRDAYIRLVVTRGTGDLGLSPSKCPRATVFIVVDSIVIYPEKVYREGVEVIITGVRRVPAGCLNPEFKTLNYMNNILAKLDGERKGFDEVLMLNVDGDLAEGSSDNVFICDGGRLRTPATRLGALPGVTRGAVLDIARDLGIPAEEARIRPEELYAASECFLTGTAAEIVPVVKVDGRPIGDGRVGPVVARLRAVFDKMTRTDGVAAFGDSAAASVPGTAG